MEKPKQVINLKYTEALDFFMQPSQFCPNEMPSYFDFGPVLQYVRDTIGDKPYSECTNRLSPASLNGVNYEFILNKDGEYGVRPITIANPYLYYFLAREICSRDNWKRIGQCLDSFAVPHFTASAIPVIPAEVEKFHKATTILNWYKSMEQRSIKLALDYKYMFVTDITNCYGCISPQAIEQALTHINTKRNKPLADNIAMYLRDMQHGRNIGLPQGGPLFDFIAEVVLGYADWLLHDKIENELGITDGYEVLRYRDDYRIFSNNNEELNKISYALQEVLESLGLRMNSNKTHTSSEIVFDAVKKDKIAMKFRTPWIHTEGDLQAQLYSIYLFGRENRNSGQLRRLLGDLNQRIETMVDEGKRILPNIVVLCSIAAQIALDNITVAHHALRTISILVNQVKDPIAQANILIKVRNKFKDTHNTQYLMLWMQNLTHSLDHLVDNNPYDNIPLCRIVMGESTDLWNNYWLKPALHKDFPTASIVDTQILEESGVVMRFRESIRYDESLEDLFLDEDDDPEEVIEEEFADDAKGKYTPDLNDTTGETPMTLTEFKKKYAK